LRIAAVQPASASGAEAKNASERIAGRPEEAFFLSLVHLFID
jgi:hypothetical protein